MQIAQIEHKIACTFICIFNFISFPKFYGHRAVRSILGVVGNDVTGFGVGLIPVCWNSYPGFGMLFSRKYWQIPVQGGPKSL